MELLGPPLIIEQTSLDSACCFEIKQEKAAGEAYRQGSSSPARQLPRRSVCAPKTAASRDIADLKEISL
jgi:hypothetical protein